MCSSSAPPCREAALHSPTSKPSPRGRESGFALIAVLALLALVLGLVTTLLVIGGRAYSDSQRALDLFTARTQAKFAATLALAELQKTAGPDQCATATGDLFSTSSAPGPQPHWSGAWNVADAPDPPDLANLEDTREHAASKGPTWLVSRPDLTVPADPALALTDPLKIADVQTLDPTQSGGMQRQAVEVDPFALAGRGGRIAWWISDEGVKAEVAADVPSTATEFQEKFREGLVPDRSAPEAAKPDLFTSVTANDPRIDLLPTLGSLSLLDSSTASEDAIPADFTHTSRGVLADQRFGGLRTDLTAAFEDDAEYDRMVGDHPAGRFVYDAGMGGPPASTVIYGANTTTDSTPLWEQFYSYYQLYRPHQKSYLHSNLMRNPRSSTNWFRSHGKPGVDMIPAHMPRNWDGNGAAAAMAPLLPRLASWRVTLAISSAKRQDTFPKADGSGTESGNYYSYRIHLIPSLTLWNPYNVEITSSFHQLWTNFLGVNSTNDGLIVAVEDSNQLKHIVFSGYFYDFGKNMLRAGTEDAVVLAPGEVRTFGFDPKDKDDLDASLELSQYLTSSSDHIPLTDFFQATTGLYGNLWDNGPSHTTYLNGLKAGSFSDIGRNDDSTHRVWVGIPYERVRSNNHQHRYNLPAGSFDVGSKLISRDQVGDHPLTTDDYRPLKSKTVSPSWWVVYAGTNGGLDLSAGGEKQIYATITVGDKPTKLEVYPPVAPYSQWGYGRRGNLADFHLTAPSVVFEPNNDGGLDVSPRTNAAGGTSLNGYWGPSQSIADGSRRFIAAQDVPRQPLLSIGELMHVEARWEVFPAYPVGNSFVPPAHDGRDKLVDTFTSLGWGSNARDSQIDDRSYLLNSTLFDSCFFSGVPGEWRENNPKLVALQDQLNGTGGSAFDTNSTPFQDDFFPYGEAFDATYVADDGSLPNPRMSIIGNPAVTDLRKYDESAGHLMIEGAFNVNSTSVAAWKSILSRLASRGVRVWNNTSYSYDDETPVNGFTRLSVPVDSGGSGDVKNDPWASLRDLSDTEIEALAGAIVDQVRERGPFLGLGDFVNRRLVSGNTDPLGYSGALQTAIDNTVINGASASEGEAMEPHVRTGVLFDFRGTSTPGDLQEQNVVEHSAVGIPGHLLQNDVLRHLAPVLAARSDTFVIRSYGEAPPRRLGGSAPARMRCEMVVQRLPEFIDESNAAFTDLDALNPLNQALGRRFRILSVRYLP